MKVDSKAVTECFDQIRYIIAGIEDTIRSGDDGFEEAVQSQSNDIVTIIKMFTAQHLTPPPPRSKKHEFLERYSEVNDRAESYQDNVDLVKARLYLWLKRELKKIDLPYNLQEHNAYNFIYDAIVSGSSSEHWWFSAFERVAIWTLDLIVTEAYEERRKHPQLLMPLDTPKQEISKKLVDLI